MYFSVRFRRVDKINRFISSEMSVIVASDLNAQQVAWLFSTDSRAIVLSGRWDEHGLSSKNTREITFLRAGNQSVLSLALDPHRGMLS